MKRSRTTSKIRPTYEGSDWHRTRLANLLEASASYPQPYDILHDGRERLAVHQNNYTEDGPDPKKLQLLWWEFPREHWEDLRLGARQNFMTLPQAHISPNAPMDKKMTIAAADFVDDYENWGCSGTLRKDKRS